MIAKVSLPYGSDLPGLIAYLYGPGRANEHTDPHLVAMAHHLDLAGAPRFDRPCQLRQAMTELDAPRRLLAPEVDGYVWHCALSLPPGERLTDAQWGDLARQVVARLGFDDGSGRAPCRWVAVRHGLSAGGNDHIHLAVNLIREDGTKASTFKDFVKLSRVCADVERRHGLQVVEGRPGRGMPGLSRAEIERARRAAAAGGSVAPEIEPEIEPERWVIARTVRACAAAARSEAEFVRALREAGLVPRPRYAEGGRDRVVGYAVALRSRTRAGGRLIFYGGGRLAADLSLPRLRERWPATGRGQAVAQWRGDGDLAPLAADPAEVLDWDQAAAVVQGMARGIEVFGRQEQTRAWAAGQLAGLLACLAQVHPDPQARPALAAAADAMARSAQTRPGQRSHTERADYLGEVVRCVRGSARAGGDAATAGMALLILTLIIVIRLVQDAHERSREHRQALRLTDAAARLTLTQIPQPDLPDPASTSAAWPRRWKRPHGHRGDAALRHLADRGTVALQRAAIDDYRAAVRVEAELDDARAGRGPAVAALHRRRELLAEAVDAEDRLPEARAALARTHDDVRHLRAEINALTEREDRAGTVLGRLGLRVRGITPAGLSRALDDARDRQSRAERVAGDTRDELDGLIATAAAPYPPPTPRSHPGEVLVPPGRARAELRELDRDWAVRLEAAVRDDTDTAPGRGRGRGDPDQIHPADRLPSHGLPGGEQQLSEIVAEIQLRARLPVDRARLEAARPASRPPARQQHPDVAHHPAPHPTRQRGHGR